MATHSQTEETGGNDNHRTEPDHTEQHTHSIERFAAALAEALPAR
jgi:hypothetical protein